MAEKQNRITLYWQTDTQGRRFLVPGSLEGRLDGEELEVVLKEKVEPGAAKLEAALEEKAKRGATRFPVFQQKAGTYGIYSEYITRHGCACCSLTTLLAAYVPGHSALRPEKTVAQVEREHFDEAVWKKNYGKHIARQMPVSLYGISRILTDCGVPHRYVGAFEDEDALREIGAHLYSDRPVVVETSRMKRQNGRIVRWFDKRFAGSYHTMILLGMDESGQVIFTDSATREWSGEWQRLKKAALSDLLAYMFPQKNTGDTHVYFSRRKNTGGYILIDA